MTINADKTVEEADWADQRAEVLLPCEGLTPWCVNEDNVPTGEHYQGDTCHAHYRTLLTRAIQIRDEQHAATLRAERERALEEAARIVIRRDSIYAEDIAAQIRALAQKGDEK